MFLRDSSEGHVSCDQRIDIMSKISSRGPFKRGPILGNARCFVVFGSVANKPRSSDIDRYFDSARVDASDMEDQNWLCDWRSVHKKKYPRMAAAARDCLAIPASEVERLFNAGRDVNGVLL
jgi:hypothetical protein